MLGMANLRPEDTGVPVVLHVFKNIDFRARHAPRVKAFPGRPHEGRATVVSIPTHIGDRAQVIGRKTISDRALHKLIAFIERNWQPLLLYWYEPEFDVRELLVTLSVTQAARRGRRVGTRRKS